MQPAPAASALNLSDLPHLVLCRHGQTDWNAEGRLQGQEEIDINERGRAEARRNGRRLAERLGAAASSFRFLASPMRRTRETMRLVRAEMGLDPEAYETDPRLVELSFGDWQGSTLQEVEAREPTAIIEREAGKWTFRPPGERAESYDMLAARVAPVFAELDRPTVMIAHGGTIRSFLKLYTGLDAATAAHRPIPQDRFIEVENGVMHWR
ncbi:histidine phosphatase family protein [Aureimonas sp. Leaf454]|uniref:histidine phosphatase family protein n=1 Tax=Aureimonas sp. Leaf454 TaxID=1736381 RepID=UPI001FCD294B|nr:histidine phosphatase family protein [Aureimonas sp. Leaf454]